MLILRFEIARLGFIAGVPMKIDGSTREFKSGPAIYYLRSQNAIGIFGKSYRVIIAVIGKPLYNLDKSATI